MNGVAMLKRDPLFELMLNQKGSDIGRVGAFA
jgi:hypothetical protein